MQVNYRTDIQGLRALAVLLVFFAHAGWTPFSGGFVGVDVFFVISGYVISQYLLKEYQLTQTLVLLNFYARRLQRLLPALVLMLITVAALSLLVLMPGEVDIQFHSAMNANFWVSNFFFHFSKLNYFGQGATESLFLHTWSLGVEEQFYLVWPIVLLFGLGGLNWQGGREERLPAVMLLILAASLMLSMYWSQTSPSSAFYMMPSRIWQFALGGLVAACALVSLLLVAPVAIAMRRVPSSVVPGTGH